MLYSNTYLVQKSYKHVPKVGPSYFVASHPCPHKSSSQKLCHSLSCSIKEFEQRVLAFKTFGVFVAITLHLQLFLSLYRTLLFLYWKQLTLPFQCSLADITIKIIKVDEIEHAKYSLSVCQPNFGWEKRKRNASNQKILLTDAFLQASSNTSSTAMATFSTSSRFFYKSIMYT